MDHKAVHQESSTLNKNVINVFFLAFAAATALSTSLRVPRET